MTEGGIGVVEVRDVVRRRISRCGGGGRQGHHGGAGRRHRVDILKHDGDKGIPVGQRLYILRSRAT